MRVTSKGQVTIPIDMRERLHIQPGSEVNFVLDGNTLRVVPMEGPSNRVRRIIERMRGTGTVKMTTDEIMALTRGED